MDKLDTKQALFDLKKRSYQMFLGQVEDEIGLAHGGSNEAAEILKAKFELKYDRYYKDSGKIIPPGVLVEENKRRKLLKELGVDLRTTIGSSLQKGEGEEEIKMNNQVEEQNQTSEFSRVKAEKERTNSLSMIPEKYRHSSVSREGGSNSTALSLVNAMANNQNSVALR